MKDKNKFLLFCANFFVVYVGLGITYCMMISYLISLNYSAGERSYMYAFGAILGMGAQFVLGYLCDKNKTIKRYAYILMIVYVFASIALYLTSKNNFFLHLALVAVNITMMRLACGIMDSWAIENGEVCKTNYGAIRAFGSIGWAIGSAIAGKIIDIAGYGSIGFAFAAAIALAILLFVKTPDAIKSATEPVNLKGIGGLIKNKGYVLLMAIFFCIFMMQCSLDYTIIDKLEILGATGSQVSTYWSLTAMVELPLFFLGGWCIKKFGTIKLLMVSTIAYAVRLFLYAMVGTVSLMLAVSLLQVITFPLITIVTKLLVDEETPDNLKSSGQQVGLAIYSSTSALISPLLAGALEDRFGVNVAIFVIALFGFVAIALTFVYVNYKKNQSKQCFGIKINIENANNLIQN